MGDDIMRPGPSISVVIPAYNCCNHISQSLSSLLEIQKRGEILEIILVDDGSVDATVETAASLGAQVIQTGGRRGPAAARNLGAERSRGDILWFVDADVVVRSDTARHIRRALTAHDVAAVFGSYDDSPQVRNFFSQYKNLIHHYFHQSIRGEASTFWAGCGAVWRDLFLQHGGFNADGYPRPSIEDIEFGYRLRDGGGRILGVPEAQGTHLKAWTWWTVITTDVRDRAVPWARLLLRRGRVEDNLNVAVTERVRAMIAGLLALSCLTRLAGLTPWWVPVVLLLIAFAANLELFALFQRRNGLLFALKGMFFHQVYYLYSIAAYCWCLAIEASRSLKSRLDGRRSIAQASNLNL